MLAACGVALLNRYAASGENAIHFPPTTSFSVGGGSVG